MRQLRWRRDAATRLAWHTAADADVPLLRVGASATAWADDPNATASDIEGRRLMTAWQPIATAPKDGTKVDLWWPSTGRRIDCFWAPLPLDLWAWHEIDEDGETVTVVRPNEQPSHWMLSPDPPDPPTGEA